MRNWTFKPRPEYPRPDRQRAFIDGLDWLNLNGPWQFRFDGDRSGETKNWFLPDGPDWREQIIVPFCWESLAAWGEAESAGNEHYFSTRPYRNPLEATRTNYRRAPRYEIGWYRRRVVIPANHHWDNKRVILTIGAADFFTDCWCNGQHLGRHEGGYTPIEFDLTDALAHDAEGNRTALLVIRVEDPMNNREQPVGKQWRWYTTVSGIWQTVFIEPRAPQYIERFEILPNLPQSAAGFRVLTRGVPHGAHVVADITCPAGERLHARIPVQPDGWALGIIPIQPLVLWDTDNPALYTLELSLSCNNVVCDHIHSYFGMRSLWTEPGPDPASPAIMCLNGKPIYLRGALYQSYNPAGIYTALDVQMLCDDIEYAKRSGFDFLRVHIKIDDPLLLYYADTMGILLMADIPNFGEGGDTLRARHRFEDLMRKAITRDFNHPSIVAWCLFNETWGFGGQTELVKLFEPEVEFPEETLDTAQKPAESAYDWIQRMWEVAKQLDATRLVEDMSVVAWDHLEVYGHADTDINSWHFYIDDYYKAKEHIDHIVEETYAGSGHNYLPGYQQRNQPLINSEYGGIGALDGDRDISWSFKFLTNELRRHGKLSAYVFTQLHDVEWEYNGLLNYDRTPKDFGYHPTAINQGDVIPLDAPPIQRCTPGQEMLIDVYSSHFSRETRRNVTLRWRLSGMDAYGKLHPEVRSGIQPINFPQYKVAKAATLAVQLPRYSMLCLLWIEALSERGEVIARNFIHFLVDNGWPADEQVGQTRFLRAEPCHWSAARWAGYMLEREGAEVENWCVGEKHGYFEYTFPQVTAGTLDGLLRMRVLCEVSAHRYGFPQTDGNNFPTTLQITLNGIPIYNAFLPNHPHDTRGTLSYLSGHYGAYGYLIHGTVEGDLLNAVRQAMGTGPLVLRFQVPPDAPHTGGLTVYGSQTGRFPVSPTVVLEWEIL